MKFEPALHLPAKAKLTWRITRLCLAADGASWLATGSKDDRVAVIRLPQLSDPQLEHDWLKSIETEFETHGFEPLTGQHEYASASQEQG